MPSTPVLVLIALTVVACAFIVALLLRIRAHRLQVTPVFGSYGGLAWTPDEKRRIADVADKLRNYSADQQAPLTDYEAVRNDWSAVAGQTIAASPENKANEQDQLSSQAAAQYVEQRRARKQSGISPDELKRFNEARTSNLK